MKPSYINIPDRKEIWLFLIFLVILCGCSNNANFKCEAINNNSNSSESYSFIPWLKYHYENISTISKSDKIKLCHASLNFIDNTGKTNAPQSIPVDYKIYLSDDKKTTSLELEASSKAQINQALLDYRSGKGAVIESYILTSNNKQLYILKTNEDYKLMFESNIVTTAYESLKIFQPSFKINGKVLYLISYYQGGNYAGAKGLEIVAIDINDNVYKISDKFSGIPESVKVESDTLIFSSYDKYLKYRYVAGKITREPVQVSDKMFSDKDLMSGSLYFDDLYQNNSKFRFVLELSLNKIGVNNLPWWIPKGTQSTLVPVQKNNNITYIYTTICEPHNCGPHIIYILYQQSNNRLIGIYKNEAEKKLILFGASPTIEEVSYLKANL